ncbi:MAG: TIGR02757 family protein [Sphingobacteriales bacterium]|nr:TIGR02757 family protein [Sphingobacteriales bacterium]OJY92435.1 MAG: TIGR02757 family protein [Sphingobacteriales bacterium 44-15]
MKDVNILKHFLDRKVEEYNHPSFIANDPISIPRRFTGRQDIEIAGFFAAILAWGNRTTIIKKCLELMEMMDNAPHAFCTSPTTSGLKKIMHFKHRTFNGTDILYFIDFFHHHYAVNESLETAFTAGFTGNERTIENALGHFHEYFFSLPDAPARTRKHIATPRKLSTCKRLNMFLRWMVRNDNAGVDFGIWKNIVPAQLVCPVDVHVARVAQRLNMIKRKQTDWLTALELTHCLRTFDPLDPVKYDFALFGLGVAEKF